MTKKLGVRYERLEDLAQFLQDDSRNKQGIQFDLAYWGESEDKSPEVSCGTSACAFGAAAVAKLFPGLTVSVESSSYTNDDGKQVYELIPKYKGKMGMEAACKLFGLTDDQAYYLFDPGSYEEDLIKGAKGERKVAKRIRNFITSSMKHEAIKEITQNLLKKDPDYC